MLQMKEELSLGKNSLAKMEKKNEMKCDAVRSLKAEYDQFRMLDAYEEKIRKLVAKSLWNDFYNSEAFLDELNAQLSKGERVAETIRTEYEVAKADTEVFNIDKLNHELTEIRSQQAEVEQSLKECTTAVSEQQKIVTSLQIQQRNAQKEREKLIKQLAGAKREIRGT